MNYDQILKPHLFWLWTKTIKMGLETPELKEEDMPMMKLSVVNVISII